MDPLPWIARAATTLLLVSSLPAAEPRWADPRGFFDQETVIETELRPGLRRIAASGLREGRVIESRILADYLLHLGAHQALNFDGGGSSALAARIEGKPQILNTPSDGRERPIPTGLGVVGVE